MLYSSPAARRCSAVRAGPSRSARTAARAAACRKRPARSTPAASSVSRMRAGTGLLTAGSTSSNRGSSAAEPASSSTATPRATRSNGSPPRRRQVSTALPNASPGLGWAGCPAGAGPGAAGRSSTSARSRSGLPPVRSRQPGAASRAADAPSRGVSTSATPRTDSAPTRSRWHRGWRSRSVCQALRSRSPAGSASSVAISSTRWDPSRRPR